MNVRVACAHIIAAVIRGDASLNSLMPTYSEQVPPRDANLLQEICFGTLRHYYGLQQIVNVLVAKPIKNKEAEVSALLLAALYQIREMRIPSHAAVNETVTALKLLKKTWAKGLVNGVLRRYLREQQAIDQGCQQQASYQHLHPQWLAKQITQDWPQQADAIFAANNERPPLCLRVNARHQSRQKYGQHLKEQQLSYHDSSWATQGIYLETPINVVELPQFDQGGVSVQDEAAQLCSQLLDLAPQQRVLDACSAPGGKACHILESEPALAQLMAIDNDSDRLLKVEQNLQRLQLKATIICADAADTDQWWNGDSFDRILLDAPCSATGVIRRHPDIKLLRKATDIVKLADTQLTLLQRLWVCLKPGGKLLYATCSVLKAENDQILHAFSQEQADCSILPIDAPWGVATAYGKQLFPQIGAHDGFYYGLLTKNA